MISAPQKMIFELGASGRKGYTLPELTIPIKEVADLIPAEFLRSQPAELPEVSELEVMRHFIALSQLITM